MKNAASIFTFEYLQQNVSIYSTHCMMDVLEVLQELFKDIPDYEQQMKVLDLLESEVTCAEGYLQAVELVACLHSGASISDDGENEFLPSEFNLSF